MKKYTILLTFLISLLTSVIIFSQTIPQTINYQGVLKDASGVVVANGDYNITFKIYDVNAAGTALWTETKLVNVVDGIVNTKLGSILPLTLPFDKAYWLGVTIGTGTELTPRVEFTSVPYSHMSMNVPNGTLTAEKIADGQVVKSINLLKDDVNLIAGSNVTITPSGTNLTISSTGGTGLTLPFEGTLNIQNTAAFYLVHTAITGSNYGVYSSISSNLGSAIYGLAPAYGIEGIATNTTGIADGVRGISSSTSGTGVFGGVTSTTGTNYGGYFQSSSSSGTGVYGVNLSTSGTTYGVFGKSNSDDDGTGVRGEGGRIGVYGFVSGGNSSVKYGMYSSANATTGNTGPIYGVRSIASGVSTVGYRYGLLGEAYGGTQNFGIYGTASGGTTSWAGYFLGNVSISGVITKGGGSFKIDHPLDPTNKYLYHSFVESPDMMNIYNGNVITDGSGYATVQLPDWFEALNKDFRYQLTVIGDFAQAIISQKVQNNQFTIRTDKPNIEVSWQVTGIRKDAWAEKNRIPVEELKTGNEVGKYIHPEVYGLPETLSIDYERNREALERK